MADVSKNVPDLPLKARLTQFIREYKHVSFVDLERQFPEIVGEYPIWFNNESLVLWWGLTAEAVDAIAELVAENQIFIWPAGEFTYHLDGKVPDAPVARKIREYKKPRWLPVTFDCRQPTEEDYRNAANAHAQ